MRNSVKMTIDVNWLKKDHPETECHGAAVGGAVKRLEVAQWWDAKFCEHLSDRGADCIVYDAISASSIGAQKGTVYRADGIGRVQCGVGLCQGQRSEPQCDTQQFELYGIMACISLTDVHCAFTISQARSPRHQNLS